MANKRKAIVRKHESTSDAQKIYSVNAMKSAEASLTASTDSSIGTVTKVGTAVDGTVFGTANRAIDSKTAVLLPVLPSALIPRVRRPPKSFSNPTKACWLHR
jgi:hypothetical protein